jgi:EAL and modified HD-GYP domain-containing signal transduction protein
MDPGRTGAQGFPLFALQPVADAHHAWAGALLDCDGGNTIALTRLFEEFGLTEALGELDCIIRSETLTDSGAAAVARVPATRVVALCRGGSGSAHETLLAALRQTGVRILYAPEGNVVPTEIQGLAMDCGRPPAPPVADALHSLPGPHLALRVDSPERFEQCKAAGFAWMAGDYPLHFASLNFSRGHGPAYALLLRLLGLVVRDAETRDIEAVLKQDPQLSFQLLRLVNSAAFAHATRIATFNQAITMLGRRQLQRWLQLLLYAHPSGEASPLLPRAAYRARFVESLCRLSGGDAAEQDRAFMTGMFSLLDAVFGRPLAELLQPLDLANDVIAALLQGEGRLGTLLNIVRAKAPRTAAAPVRALLAEAGLDCEQHARAMVEAFHWAARVGRDR